VVDDPWEAITSSFVKPHAFGLGSTKHFGWYFEGDSSVPVASIDDICRWLAACVYVRDPVLFREPDFWQHPCTFEQIRKGDCEDHALWAWRKLHELGIEAEFYSGQWGRHAESGSHAWVVFQQDNERYVLESVGKDTTRMVRRLHEVRDEYVPHFSVDAQHRMQARAGYILYLRELDQATPKAGKRPN
jgi:hypothetical protein